MRARLAALAPAAVLVTAATAARAQPPRAPAPAPPAASTSAASTSAASTSAAPTSAAPRPARAPRVTRTLATNPLALPFGVASGEYEQALGAGGLAVGVGALTTLGRDATVANDGGSLTFRSAQLKLKYYPREDGLRGFAVGVTAGVASERELRERSSVVDAFGRETVLYERSVARTAPTVGATLDYNLFLGRRRRFLVGLGAGTRRALGVARDGALGDPLVDGRLQVGVGF